MINFLLVVLGWLLGVIHVIYRDHLLRKRTARRACASIVADLHILQTMAFHSAKKYGDKCGQTQLSFLPRSERYMRAIPDDQLGPQVKIAFQKLAAAPKAELDRFAQDWSKGDVVAKRLKLSSLEIANETPFLLRSDLQRALFRISAQVDLHNQSADKQNRFFYSTFEESYLSGVTSIVDENLSTCYRELYESSIQLLELADSYIERFEQALSGNPISEISSKELFR